MTVFASSCARVARLTALICVNAGLLGLAVAPPSWAQTRELFSSKVTSANAPDVSRLLAEVGPVAITEQVRAELLVHAPQGIQAGQTFWLGLQIQHQPHWHTYWQNPGDSGLPTRLQWKLPDGLQAGEIAWPLPKKISIGNLANYGYEGHLLLMVPVTVNADHRFPSSGGLPIELRAEWLVCRQECIPQEAQFALNLPSAKAQADPAALFEAALKRQPQTLPQQRQGGAWISGGQTTLANDARQLVVRVHGLPVAWRGQALSAFPITPGVVRNAAKAGQDWTQQWQGAVWSAQIPVSDERGDGPRTMHWLIAQGPESSPQAPAFVVETPVQGTWPALSTAAPAEISPALAKALAENARKNDASRPAAPASATSALSLTLVIFGAFWGGLLLNLMPCVFPVLAIKMLGFAQTPSGPVRSVQAQHRAAGLAYAAGVVLSFMLLGGLMLVLRTAGEQLGWGFQLQSPLVVAALAVLFTLLGLNLAGVFEFGQLLPSRLVSLQSRHPTLNAGLSGALAVAVASPCTAPFMGAALGLAIAMPVWQALAVFATMGLGMALPYLAASVWSGFARALPRPGPWMVVFRQAMAFPMLATVIWLLWVLGQQTSMDAASVLLALLLTMACLVWACGLAGRTRWVMSALATGALVWLGSSWWPLVWRAPSANALGSVHSATNIGMATRDHKPSAWQAWSTAAQQAHLDAGRAVFVDFTAAWCVTCQYNKKTTFADAALLDDFAARQVVLMRADWTRRDPAITEALTTLGRSGVPVYALYAPDRPPVLLSELPSVNEVRTALKHLPPTP